MPVVLLLQEVYRSGPDVPRDLDRRASFASRLGVSMPRRFARVTRHRVAGCRARGFSAYYAPSMRNGVAGGVRRGSRQCHSLEPAARGPDRHRAAVRAPAPRRGRRARSGRVRHRPARRGRCGSCPRTWTTSPGPAACGSPEAATRGRRQARALVTYLADAAPDDSRRRLQHLVRLRRPGLHRRPRGPSTRRWPGSAARLFAGCCDSITSSSGCRTGGARATERGPSRFGSITTR